MHIHHGEFLSFRGWLEQLSEMVKILNVVAYALEIGTSIFDWEKLISSSSSGRMLEFVPQIIGLIYSLKSYFYLL